MTSGENGGRAVCLGKGPDDNVPGHSICTQHDYTRNGNEQASVVKYITSPNLKDTISENGLRDVKYSFCVFQWCSKVGIVGIRSNLARIKYECLQNSNKIDN